MSVYESKFWLNYYDETMPREIEVPDDAVRDWFIMHTDKHPEKTYLYFRDMELS